jgi:Predicted thioesterase
MKKYPYFHLALECADGSPAPTPLRCCTKRPVRFEEVDSLQIVWHGRYPSYLEDGRMAFGTHFGLGYLVMYEAGLVAPIRQMHIDYIAPLRFDQTCTIETTLLWNDAAKLVFVYRLFDESGSLLTTAYTIQLFVTTEGEMCMGYPDFFQQFCNRWKRGELGR